MIRFRLCLQNSGGKFKEEKTSCVKFDHTGGYTATYEAAEKAHFVPGDINGDGEVDNKDVVVLFRYVSGSDITVNEIALDVNGDREVDNKDVTVLFRHLSNGEIKLSDKPYSPVNINAIIAVIAKRIRVI